MADAAATGVLRGNTITLDATLPALEGRRVQVIIAPLDSALEDPVEHDAAVSASWPAWLYPAPSSSALDEEEQEFP